MRRLIFFILSVLSLTLQGQTDNTRLIRYTPDFKFKEGLYISFDQVKANDPVPVTRIVTTVAYDNPDFFDIVLKEKELMLLNDLGVRAEINTSETWGFSRNGTLYIRINEGFYRVTVIGSICHFVANLTTYYNNSFNNPYYYSASPYYSYPYSSYYSPYTASGNTEVRQYLLDFNTGNVLEYDVKSVEILLMADAELYDEYSGLSNKKKKQLKYMYIRKYNEKHPLFFPE